MTQESIILITPPEALRQVRDLPVTVAHQAYRVGRGPHLFRAGPPVALRGGLMALDAQGFDGRGEGRILCDEIVRECVARGFQGVVCDFEGPILLMLERVVRELGERFARRGWRLYVPEEYGHCTHKARVMVSSAISGGTLHGRLEEAMDHWGRSRVAVALERSAEDFFLPSPTGSGRKLSRSELQEQLERRQPSVFFSPELCARYFTYMSREDGAHFVLFDDGATLRKKLEVARGLGVGGAVMAWEEVEDAIGQILKGCL